jgi:D-glycero-alpha-D-manno-heptose 1-phosphate guanylyltransferase
MMKINGKFFLFFLLELLISKGFKDIILCTGHGHQIIKELVGDRYKSIQISYSKEENALGTGGAILQALNLFNDQKFFVLNGDSYCDFDADLQVFSNNSINYIFIYNVSDVSRYGEVKINAVDNSVSSFIEKKPSSSGGFINSGIYIFNRYVFKNLDKGKFISLETEILPHLIGNLKFILCDKGFIDIGTPNSLFRAEKFLLEHRSKNRALTNES